MTGFNSKRQMAADKLQDGKCKLCFDGCAVCDARAQPAQKHLTCIRALTDQCATLIWEQEELQKQVWRYEKNGVTCQTYGHKIDSSCSECNVHENYTTPPQRTWVGLTDEEAEAIWEDHQFNGRPSEVSFANRMNLMQAIEAKLKEKNNGT